MLILVQLNICDVCAFDVQRVQARVCVCMVGPEFASSLFTFMRSRTKHQADQQTYRVVVVCLPRPVEGMGRL